MNNMKRIVLLPIIFLTLGLSSGCASLKEATGEYVTESVVMAIEKKVDEKLAERKLSRDEIVKLIDENVDGKVSSEEAFKTVKELAKDYASITGQQIVDAKIKEISEKLVSKSELEGKNQEMFNYLIITFGGLLSSYLGKQWLTAKSDGHRDARITVLEKLLQKDIDGDGVIGNNENTIKV